jgi:predicted SprT family Zn-dependent metalloprotease
MTCNFTPGQESIVLWTMKLYEEYQSINLEYRLKLTPATLVIAPLGSKWGEFNSQGNMISLNLVLFENYSWDTIIEILKHEIVHQYIFEYIRQDDKPHGKIFKEISERLGLATWARQATIDLPKDPFKIAEEKTSEEQDRLLRKAEKLLALAESSSEHEAALAMERVRDLYAKYNLQKLQYQKDEGYYSCIITRRKQKIDASESLIFSVLMEFFFVKVITRTLYDHKQNSHHKGAELLGKLENVKLAEYVFHFLWNQASMRSKQISHKTKTSMMRRDFRYGLIKGFAAKMREKNPLNTDIQKDEKPVSTEDQRLILREDRSLESFQNKRYPRLISRSFGPGRPMDKAAFSAGYSAGKSLDLHKGLHQKPSGFGGFLK